MGGDIQDKASSNRHRKYGLPWRFKFIGIGVFLGMFALGITLKLLDYGQEYSKSVFWSGLLLGMLLFALSRDREEDELIMYLCLKAAFLALTFGVVLVILTPITDAVFGETTVTEDPAGIVFMMLGMYLFYFYGMKRKR